jgi:hypothetical protein
LPLFIDIFVIFISVVQVLILKIIFFRLRRLWAAWGSRPVPTRRLLLVIKIFIILTWRQPA